MGPTLESIVFNTHRKTGERRATAEAGSACVRGWSPCWTFSRARWGRRARKAKQVVNAGQMRC